MEEGDLRMNASRRIVVVGAGAIGGITAALMRKAGEDVTLVCKHPEVAALAANPGLRISGICGNQIIPVPAVATLDELTGTFDLALHDWFEPFERITALAHAQQVPLLMPQIGAPVQLSAPPYWLPWWRQYDTELIDIIDAIGAE